MLQHMERKQALRSDIQWRRQRYEDQHRPCQERRHPPPLYSGGRLLLPQRENAIAIQAQHDEEAADDARLQMPGSPGEQMAPMKKNEWRHARDEGVVSSPLGV